MRKIFSVMIILYIALCCGCAETVNPSAAVDSNPVIISMPDDDSVNGYRVYTASESSSGQTITGQYYANKDTKKFHTASCRYAKNMKEENKYVCSDRQQLIDECYSPCKICKP